MAPGSGKTHIVSALAERWLRREPTGIVTLLSAAEWIALAEQDRTTDPFTKPVRTTCYFLVQHLSVQVQRSST